MMLPNFSSDSCSVRKLNTMIRPTVKHGSERSAAVPQMPPTPGGPKILCNQMLPEG